MIGYTLFFKTLQQKQDFTVLNVSKQQYDVESFKKVMNLIQFNHKSEFEFHI